MISNAKLPLLTTLASVKLFIVANLVCVMFMFVTTMLFLLNKKKKT
jgi:hypothetical protein